MSALVKSNSEDCGADDGLGALLLYMLYWVTSGMLKKTSVGSCMQHYRRSVPSATY